MAELRLETRIQGFNAGVRISHLFARALKGKYSDSGILRTCPVWLQHTYGEIKKNTLAVLTEEKKPF